MLFAFMDADFCLVCIGNYSIASLSHEAFANHQMTNDSASIYYLQDLVRGARHGWGLIRMRVLCQYHYCPQWSELGSYGFCYPPYKP
jgi:hypothetical protein